jgi:hypothetical protein
VSKRRTNSNVAKTTYTKKVLVLENPKIINYSKERNHDKENIGSRSNLTFTKRLVNKNLMKKEIEIPTSTKNVVYPKAVKYIKKKKNLNTG